MTAIEIVVPATTANLGPGFDCLGAALDLYNHFWFSPRNSNGEDPEVNIVVRGKDDLSFGKDNLVYRAFARAFELRDRPIPSVNIEIELNVPMSRGLGSSATAIVGGLLGANALGELNLARETLLQLAIAVEGHPDNVVPALQGGCQLSVLGGQGRWTFCPIDWHADIHVVAVVPDFKLSTEKARDILPQAVSLPDAIFTQAHLALLIRALGTGNSNWLTTALDDRIHQPYRAELIAGFKTVQTAAVASGAYGVTISGSGPTLIAFCSGDLRGAIGEAMVNAWEKLDVTASAKLLNLDRQGGRILSGA